MTSLAEEDDDHDEGVIEYEGTYTREPLSLCFSITKLTENFSEIEGPIFKVPIEETCQREEVEVPYIITRCVEEVERRGLNEVGIYRVSGLSTEICRLSCEF